uniref:JAB_MPN domain-containing protein n=1 Tax=Heterorhabditis bacteriophora TaxID=37862 RepID=A0A1I7XPS2_HETBA
MAPLNEDVRATSSSSSDVLTQKAGPHCVSAVHINLPVQKVTVHPLVLLSVVDHFNRVSKTQSVKRVVGVLLGSMKKDKTLDIGNSFAGYNKWFVMLYLVPFDEEEKDKSTWFLDMDYLESMYSMFHKVSHTCFVAYIDKYVFL